MPMDRGCLKYQVPMRSMRRCYEGVSAENALPRAPETVFTTLSSDGGRDDQDQADDDVCDGCAVWRLQPEHARDLHRRPTGSQFGDDVHPVADARQPSELLAGQSRHGSADDDDGPEQ